MSNVGPSPGQNDALLNLFNKGDQSIPVFLDQIFGFLASHKPDALLTSTGITLEHLVSQAVSKWRCKLSQQRSATQEISSRGVSTPTDTSSEAAGQDSAGHYGGVEVPAAVEVECAPFSAAGGAVGVPHPTPAQSTSTTTDATNDDITYYWSQTMEDVDVRLPLPSNINKGKQVDVSIQSSRVNVTLRDALRTSLLCGDWHRPVDASESMWDMTPGKHLTLHLSKLEAAWWGGEGAVREVRGAMEGSIQPERHYNSLPSEEQADIRKIIFDAEQKAAGKPTSDALKMESMLREAWDAEGSPFKGQPFDLNSVNIAPPDHIP